MKAGEQPGAEKYSSRSRAGSSVEILGKFSWRQKHLSSSSKGREGLEFVKGREGLGCWSPVRQGRLPSLTRLLSPAGEAVTVVGFGVFGQACGPSVTSGILSAVVQVDDTPVMLQTTCAVHGGSSGGPLFSTCSGNLLGN